MNRDRKTEHGSVMTERRDFLAATLGFSAASLLTTGAQAQQQPGQPGGRGSSSIENATMILKSPKGRRKLGTPL